ncbi:MAG: NAD(+) synthase [Candidatus Binatia bacterium]|nr:NAD(+) synthase [Candidatus Binatia bacterium]
MKTSDRLWRALADPHRRGILEALRSGPRTTGELADGSEITRYGVMKHLATLVEAGLVRVERRGRERWNHLIPDRLDELGHDWNQQLDVRPKSNAERSFFDLYAHGFVRAAISVPRVHLADPAANAAEIAATYRAAVREGAALVLFPELALSGYSLDDLHQQDALLRAVLEGLAEVVAATEENTALAIVGAPLRFQGRLYNCAVFATGGRILGITPKTYVPNYREFYEKRQFTSGRDALATTVPCLGQQYVPFGSDLIFRDERQPDFAVHAEICEDVWVAIPPSTYAAFHGATVLTNLSASNVTIGKSSYRQQLAAGQSAKTLSAYLYAAAGTGESTTDLAWDGHALAYEDGERLVESERFVDEAQLVFADIDLDRLVQERARMTSFADCAADHRAHTMRTIPFRFTPPTEATHLRRTFERLPFVPSDPMRRAERCYEAYNIQVTSLVKRLRATGITKLVIGISGGLDSTQALLVSARAMDHLELPRTNVLAYTMPGFATSKETRSNAHDLMKAFGVTASEIDIRPSSEQMLSDIGHPHALGKERYDITYENVQAGERTSHLFRLANHHGALVVGTGDLSELALGWCTYGVGDQMSHYNVNVSVPKTLIHYLIEWVADLPETGKAGAAVLGRILATEISPELIPAHATDGEIQSTEKTIGPYELHDFDLYYMSRRGYAPSKVALLFAHAWSSDTPVSAADGKYPMEEILSWQRSFLDRFFRTSQFKRSASPNGPKVGSGGSLSPRGDWRAPSDSTSAPWLADLAEATSWIERSTPKKAKKRRAR